jgi:taurine dioxygenase
MAVFDKLRMRPLLQDFGVEIMDIDLARAGPEDLAAVVAAFHRHGAIVIRGQKLDQPAQLAFTRLFGEPEVNARPEFCDPDYPRIYVLSNKTVNGRPIGDRDAGMGWHSDLSYSKRTALCTILHALEVPKEGSDTLLADLCAAWNALPEDRQRALDGLVVHHSFTRLMGIRGVALTQEQIDAYPDVWHPLVRRHPADGRKSLFISAVQVKGIVGMEDEAAIRLVDDLVAFATQERFVYRHRWQAGDILAWDNRCTLHRATRYDLDRDVRHVHRTWVQGDIPV